MFQVTHLSFSYDKKRKILDDISFSAQPGEILSIIGPNGTGKTTLLNCIVGGLSPSQGMLSLNGRLLNEMTCKERAHHMGYVPQAMKSDLNIKVMDYILLGRSPYFKFSYSKQNRQIVERVMDEVGVSAFAMRDLKHLSGGERQKVSICRALVQEPEILLLDEPTSALDIRNQIDVLRLLRQISRSRCLTIIMSIHDLSLSLMFSDTALMLHGARIARQGQVSHVITPESIRQVYQVEASVIGGKYIHLHG